MSKLITPEILDTGIKVLGLGIVAKSLDGPIQTINDIWGLFGGDWLHAKRLKCQQKYAEKIVEKVVNIPPEKLQEPKLSILGPALEASKFYIEEEEIREMFANLIAASMNSDYNDYIQHSFVEIIKQLTPYDAKLFKFLNNDFDLYTDYDGIQSYQTEEFPNRKLNAISLNNLKRHGLIEIYDKYSIEKVPSDPLSDILSKNSFHKSLLNPKKEYETHTSTYGYITELGKLFKKICLGKLK